VSGEGVLADAGGGERHPFGLAFGQGVRVLAPPFQVSFDLGFHY
jgi:hypothetical protein